VSAQTRLIDLFDLVGRHVVPLGVVDDAGRLIGVIPRAALLATLSDRKGPVHA
jgi:glycine betaine/proline transport system ATP-binding protein